MMIYDIQVAVQMIFVWYFYLKTIYGLLGYCGQKSCCRCGKILKVVVVLVVWPGIIFLPSNLLFLFDSATS